MAFKMSPIGKRKCPYSPLQKRGLINPSPVMNNGDDKKNQQKAQDNANKNVKWNKPGEWKVDPDNPNREMRITTGDGTGEYYVGKEKMDPEEWKKWLQTPAGKRYTALQNVEKVEYRDINKPKNEIQKKSKPVYANITDYLRDQKIKVPFETSYTEEIQLPGGRYMNVKKQMTPEEISNKIEQGYGELWSRYRNATQNKDIEGGTTTEIGRDGRQEELDMYVDQNLDLNAAALTNINNEETTVKSSGESN